MLKLFRLIKPYRGYVALVLVLALAQSIGFLLLPRLMSDIVDKGIVKGDQRAILEIGGLMLLVSIAATACAIGGSYCSSKVATGFGRTLRSAIFARVEHFSIHQFDRFSSASLAFFQLSTSGPCPLMRLWSERPPGWNPSAFAS